MSNDGITAILSTTNNVLFPKRTMKREQGRRQRLEREKAAAKFRRLLLIEERARALLGDP